MAASTLYSGQSGLAGRSNEEKTTLQEDEYLAWCLHLGFVWTSRTFPKTVEAHPEGHGHLFLGIDSAARPLRREDGGSSPNRRSRVKKF